MDIAVAGESNYLFVEVAGLVSGLTMTAKVYELATWTLVATLPASDWTTPGAYRTNAKFTWAAEKQYQIAWEGAGAVISKAVQSVLPGSPLWGQVAAKKVVRTRLATTVPMTAPMATVLRVPGKTPAHRVEAVMPTVRTIRVELTTETARTLGVA